MLGRIPGCTSRECTSKRENKQINYQNKVNIASCPAFPPNRSHSPTAKEQHLSALVIYWLLLVHFTHTNRERVHSSNNLTENEEQTTDDLFLNGRNSSLRLQLTAEILHRLQIPLPSVCTCLFSSFAPGARGRSSRRALATPSSSIQHTSIYTHRHRTQGHTRSYTNFLHGGKAVREPEDKQHIREI